MACSDVHPAGARDHVTEVNHEMLSELARRTCPRCGCQESRPVDGEMARLPLRVCVACNDVFGFDDSTSVPEHLLPHDEQDSSFGGRIWNHDDDVRPRRSSPCFRNSGWSSGSEDRDNDERHPEDRDPPGRGGGRGGRRRGDGCGRGRGHHHGEDGPQHRHQHRRRRQHQCAGRGHQGAGSGSADESSCRDRWNQVVCTCVQSGKCAAKGAACSLLAGDYGGAVGSVSNEMEPVGRAVGSALGSVAGNVIGSPRAGEIAAEMGAMVGSGVAEMLKDSNLCNRRTSSHYD